MAKVGKPYNFDRDTENGCGVQRWAGRAISAERGEATDRDLAAAGYTLYWAAPMKGPGVDDVAILPILAGLLEGAVEAGDTRSVRAITAAIDVL